MSNKTIGIAEEELAGLAEDIGFLTPEQAQECAAFVENELAQIVDAFESGRNSSD